MTMARRASPTVAAVRRPRPSPATASPSDAVRLVRRRAPRARCATRATRELGAPRAPRSRSCCTSSTPRAPRPYRRKNAPTFVVALADLPETPADVLRTGYPLLVRGLANLVLMVSDGPERLDRRLRHPRAGHLRASTPRATTTSSSPTVFARVEPLATSRLVIANEFLPDLPPELWDGDDQTAPDRPRRRAARRARPPPRPRSRSRRSCPSATSAT